MFVRAVDKKTFHTHPRHLLHASLRFLLHIRLAHMRTQFSGSSDQRCFFQWPSTHLSSQQSCQNIAHRLAGIGTCAGIDVSRGKDVHVRSHPTHPKYRSAPISKHLRVLEHSNLDTAFFCSPVVSHSRTRRPRGLEEKLFEHVVPLTRNLSGAVSIERTVCGHPSASLVWDKTVEDILCSLVGEHGTPATSVHTEKNDNYPRHLYVDEKTVVCRKESLALMWTEQRNTFDLEGSQSGFAAPFIESNQSHHGRNQHNQRGCFVRNSTQSPQEKTLQHADIR